MAAGRARPAASASQAAAAPRSPPVSHRPGGTRRAAAATLSSASRGSRTSYSPTRKAHAAAFPKCVCASMKPGSSSRPASSTTVVSGPRRASTSRSDPTLTMRSRPTGAARQHRGEHADGDPADHEDHTEDREERERVAGPLDAEALGGPEDAEAREHRADAELHRVLRDPRERVLEGDADPGHQHAGRDRAPDRRVHRRDPGRAEGDDDERDLETLEEHGLVRDDRPDPVPLLLAETLGP